MNETRSMPSPDGIAIVGMSGRFPGARDVDQFWKNLVEGVDCISRFQEQDLEYTLAKPGTDGDKFIGARGVIEGVDLFDADFFGMYPREAQLIDPQHRLFLECAWEALENAGHDPERYPGLIGVYAGLSMNTYLLHNLCADRKFVADFSANYQVGSYPTMLGNDKDFMPTRVSYKLNLRGPSITVQCACSTSLVAICQACTSLSTYQCDMALAGGVSITFPQKRNYAYQEEGLASADGTCRTFDAAACGTVFGHGVAVLLLKRVEDAMADGDSILAVIKGFALNNDGCDKIGYAAPSMNAQAEVIAMAQAAAGILPDTVSYVEAHGTATPLGDPIEVAALTAAFRRGGATRNQYCALGTGKTHIGHLDIAAGATGVIKTVLQLQHEFIPPLLHFKSPNPKIDFGNSPFFPVSSAIEWKRNGTPRRAGVSAFGIGGTNAHVVIEEAPAAEASSPSRRHQLLLISAKAPTALASMSKRLADYLENHPNVSLADVAFTLQRGRQQFRHREALCAASVKQAVERLRSAEDPVIAQAPAEAPSVVFLFPGQGSQQVGMGRDLYDGELVFREAVDGCAERLLDRLGLDIRSILYPDAISKPLAETQIHETRVTQPAIFTVEYALACLWMSWGIKPSLLIGHSVGEYVAAVLAGVFSLEDALRLLAGRAKLMQDLPGGSMLAVRKSATDLEMSLPEGIAIAAINSPLLTTLSGPTSTLQELQKTYEASKIFCRILPTSHAFHSPMMDPMLESLSALAASVRQHRPTIPWISTLTGTWMDDQMAPDSSYWVSQVRRTVRFGQAVETAMKNGATTFLEVGPGQALTQLTLQQPAPSTLTAVTSLAPYDADSSNSEAMLTALGRLWVSGIQPDWGGFYATEKRRRLSLPTYPFERKSYWIAPPAQQRAPVANALGIANTENAQVPAVPPEISPVVADAQFNSYRLIEKQVELMTQQLEVLRRRAVRGRLNHGK